MLAASGFTPGEIAQAKEQLSAVIPLGRTAHPDEVARAVLFLASDESSFTAGGELFVDGGLGQV